MAPIAPRCGGQPSCWQCPLEGINELIREHGEDAALEAAMRADAMLDKGDLEGQVVWKRIVRAVEEIQRTDRPSGEVLQ